jgi:hypothetical protein
MTGELVVAAVAVVVAVAGLVWHRRIVRELTAIREQGENDA